MWELRESLRNVNVRLFFFQAGPDMLTMVGTTQSAIARMESGKVVPRLESLAKIARACGKKLELVIR